jgi:hypothetical protein
MSTETNQPAPDPTPARKVSWARLLLPVFAFIVMLVWSNIPPYRAHRKHEARDYFVWHWHLYQQGGAGVCDVRYYDMKQDGQLLERWKLFGFERSGDMPDEIARVHHKELRRDHDRVCAALREAGDAKPNVQVFARCGLDGGWKTISERKRNICGPAPKPKKSQTAKPQQTTRSAKGDG